MAGWIIGVREVRTVEVPAENIEGKHGPVVLEEVRQVDDLPADRWARLVGLPVDLPITAGAGPCGTALHGLRWWPRFLDPNRFLGERWVNRDPKPYIRAPRPLAWSIRHLVEPIAAYYATYVPPMRFGAKPGPRGRRAA